MMANLMVEMFEPSIYQLIQIKSMRLIMSKEMSKEEMRDLFLGTCEMIAFHWINNVRAVDCKDKVEGAIFSIMNIFDGSSGSFPAAIDLVMRPHEDDKQYCIDEDSDWVVDGQVINDDVHLHDMIFKER